MVEFGVPSRPALRRLCTCTRVSAPLLDDSYRSPVRRRALPGPGIASSPSACRPPACRVAAGAGIGGVVVTRSASARGS
jgi:hypothetical protein